MGTVFNVEDDTDTSEAIAEYLRSCGYRTILAADGADVITLFRDNDADVVVLDIMLPAISGLEVLRVNRAESEVPVLMLTALDDEQTQIASFDQLADDYMTKPFSLVILAKRIADLLRRSGHVGTAGIWTYKDVTVDFAGYCASDESGDLDVTPRELELVNLSAFELPRGSHNADSGHCHWSGFHGERNDCAGDR